MPINAGYTVDRTLPRGASCGNGLLLDGELQPDPGPVHSEVRVYDDRCPTCGVYGAPRRYVSRTEYECLGDRLYGVHMMPYGQVPEFGVCGALLVDREELARLEHERKLKAEDAETETARQRMRTAGYIERVCRCGRLATVECTRAGEWVCNRLGTCAHDVEGRLVCSECRTVLDRERDEQRERERRAAEEQRERERRAAEEERERERRDAEERRRAAYDALPEVTVDELAAFASDGSVALRDGVTHKHLDRVSLSSMAEALTRVHGAVEVAWPGRDHDLERASFSWLVLTPDGRLVQRAFSRPVTASARLADSIVDGEGGRPTVAALRSARPFGRLVAEARSVIRQRRRDDARRERRRRSEAARWERRRLIVAFMRNLGIVLLLLPLVLAVYGLSLLH